MSGESKQLFAQLAKVDVAKRQVTGVIASEAVDHANEIFDYDTSKPLFEAWSNGVAKMSGGKSVGNVRAMHGNVAAGTLSEIAFDDVNKTISVVADIVDDNEWNKVLKGVYTGFSIGGAYVKKWTDAVVKTAKRYTAKPGEVSIVDIGCNPEAMFTMCKADGMETQVKFEDTVAGILSKINDEATPAEEQPALALALAKAYGHNLSDPDDGEEELRKSAYSIGRLAELAESARYMVDGYGVNLNGVVQPFTDNVKKGAKALYDALLQMVNSDVDAAKAVLKDALTAMQAESEEPLRKALSDGESLTASLDNMVKALGCESGEVGPAMEKIGKLITDGEELQKKYDEQSTKLTEVEGELEKLKGQPAPAKGVKTVVAGKETDGVLGKGDGTGEGGEADSKDPMVLMKRAQSAPQAITSNGVIQKIGQ